MHANVIDQAGETFEEWYIQAKDEDAEVKRILW